MDINTFSEQVNQHAFNKNEDELLKLIYQYMHFAKQYVRGDSETLMHVLCRYNLPNVLEKVIIEKLFDVNEIVKNKTAIFTACGFDNIECFIILLKYGASLNICIDNVYPINYACRNGSEKILHYMAINNLLNEQETLPLHLCAQYGKLRCVELLVFHGANVSLRNSYGKYARTVATEKKHNDIEQFLYNAELYTRGDLNPIQCPICDPFLINASNTFLKILPENEIERKFVNCLTEQYTRLCTSFNTQLNAKVKAIENQIMMIEDHISKNQITISEERVSSLPKYNFNPNVKEFTPSFKK